MQIGEREQKELNNYFIRTWIEDEVIPLAQKEDFSANDLRESYQQFRQDHPQASFTLPDLWAAAMELGDFIVALKLIDPIIAILKEDLDHLKTTGNQLEINTQAAEKKIEALIEGLSRQRKPLVNRMF